MSAFLDTFPNEDTLPHSAAETRYWQALAGLERAQAERTQAVCQFLSAQAEWKITAAYHRCGEDPLLEQATDPLVQAEEQVRQMKILYGAALEQQCLFQRLLNRLHDTYQTAQENRDRLALNDHNEVLLCPPFPRFQQE